MLLFFMAGRKIYTAVILTVAFGAFYQTLLDIQKKKLWAEGAVEPTGFTEREDFSDGHR